MPTLLLNLRGVPDDEADEVRALLARHQFDTYETPPNRWGISMGGIWLRDDTRVDEARAVLADYQEERKRRKRAEYEERLRRGDVESFATLFVRHPMRHAFYIAVIGGLILLMTLPFVRFWG
jgi:hypothetical protein